MLSLRVDNLVSWYSLRVIYQNWVFARVLRWQARKDRLVLQEQQLVQADC